MPPTSTNPTASARTALLTRMLDAYESSPSYGKPGPWKREVVARFDRHEFPEAFAAGARDELAAFNAAALELERAGAVRLTRAGDSGEIKEVRLGPEQVEPAFRLGQAEGYEPLGAALRGLAEHARALRMNKVALLPGRGPIPEWMARSLEFFGDLPENPELIPMPAPAFKAEWRELAHALTAATALARGMSGWEHTVSERIFGSPERLGELRGSVASLLATADPQWGGADPEDPVDLLAWYGVRRSAAVIHCAGGGTLEVNGSAYHLEDFAPSAKLPEGWASAWSACLRATGIELLTTIENGYAFERYVEEAGGPVGLDARREVAVCTGGYPAPGLAAAIGQAARLPGVHVRHWGDASPEGLRVWWRVRNAAAAPVQLIRTTAEWVRSESRRRGVALTPVERGGLKRLRACFEASPWRGEADVKQALGVLDAMAASGVRIAQERWREK